MNLELKMEYAAEKYFLTAHHLFVILRQNVCYHHDLFEI